MIDFLGKLQRPPSSSLSFTAGNDDVRSPGSQGTPGPLSQPPNSQHSTDNGSEPELLTDTR
ncbi:Homeobox protein homothorax [Orchesella cincta]|uniref:Homeobox protein homothorax n=1 Tax=Orchesella cincta TaxID=48709 RepID=A0A1D2NB95_ORCCI|nr:Homeobox protein homothorax [Orchesella cincta]